MMKIDDKNDLTEVTNWIKSLKVAPVARVRPRPHRKLQNKFIFKNDLIISITFSTDFIPIVRILHTLSVVSHIVIQTIVEHLPSLINFIFDQNDLNRSSDARQMCKIQVTSVPGFVQL